MTSNDALGPSPSGTLAVHDRLVKQLVTMDDNVLRPSPSGTLAALGDCKGIGTIKAISDERDSGSA